MNCFIKPKKTEETELNFKDKNKLIALIISLIITIIFLDIFKIGFIAGLITGSIIFSVLHFNILKFLNKK